MLNLSLQDFVFGSSERLALMEYLPQSENTIRIGIYRNHSFELVEHTMSPFLDFSGMKADFIYSDYDDSLSFFNLDATTDLLILWLDLQRYHTESLNAFLQERLDVLETLYKKPVLIAFLGSYNLENNNRIVEFNIEKVHEKLGMRFFDLRLEAFSGTKLSPAACMEISRELGLNYIPALTAPILKALVVDLDNTLYQGVLGEDGYENLNLTPGHAGLQKALKALKNQGFFLCAASKNNQDDVVEMFRLRKDFPLQLSDFSKVVCSWEDKSLAIQEIIKYLNIGADSILFIDDNPGELISVNRVIPDAKFLLAQDDARKTLQVLSSYPGLLKLRSEYEDSIRTTDIRANQKRSELKDKMSEHDYIRSLNMKLTFNINDVEQITRISELANKTNQFIFGYKRYSAADVKRLMEQQNSVVISVKLADDLSDSGIIGVCVAEKKQDYMNVSECFVSCRALGRGIDDIIVCMAIDIASRVLMLEKVHVDFQKGPRNSPAELFKNKYLNEYGGEPTAWRYVLPAELVEINIEGAE